MTDEYDKKLELSKQVFDLFPEYIEPNNFSDQQMTDGILDVYSYLPEEYKSAVDYFMQESNREEAQNLYTEYLKFAKKNPSKDGYIDMLHSSLASVNEDGRINGEKYKFQAIKAYRDFFRDKEIPNKKGFLKEMEPFLEAYNQAQDLEPYKNRFREELHEQKAVQQRLSSNLRALRRGEDNTNNEFHSHPIGRKYYKLYHQESDFFLGEKRKNTARGYRFDSIHYPLSMKTEAHYINLHNEVVQSMYDMCVNYVEAAEKCATANNKHPNLALKKGEFKQLMQEFDKLYDSENQEAIIDRINELHEEASNRFKKTNIEVAKQRTMEGLGFNKDSVLLKKTLPENIKLGQSSDQSTPLR